jgi:hypothetical protein
MRKSKMASDADTIANAELLWKLVHAVQDTIGKHGEPLVVPAVNGAPLSPLAELRKLADELDPEYGKY